MAEYIPDFTDVQNLLDEYIFGVILTMLERSKEYPLDTDIKIRIIQVEAQISTFYSLFGLSLGTLILTHSDNPSKTLLHQFMSAAEGQHVARSTLDVLKSIRQPENFYHFYQRVLG